MNPIAKLGKGEHLARRGRGEMDQGTPAMSDGEQGEWPYYVAGANEPVGYYPRRGIVRGARILIRREGEPDMLMVVDHIRPTGRYSFTVDMHAAHPSDTERAGDAE